MDGHFILTIRIHIIYIYIPKRHTKDIKTYKLSSWYSCVGPRLLPRYILKYIKVRRASVCVRYLRLYLVSFFTIGRCYYYYYTHTEEWISVWWRFIATGTVLKCNNVPFYVGLLELRTYIYIFFYIENTLYK